MIDIAQYVAYDIPMTGTCPLSCSAINFILRDFVMSKISNDLFMNMNQIVELLRPQLEVTKEDIEPVILMGLYHHRDLIGSPSAFIKASNDILP